MGKGVFLSLHLLGDPWTHDTLQSALFNDGKEQVFVGFVIPLGRHVAGIDLKFGWGGEK